MNDELEILSEKEFNIERSKNFSNIINSSELSHPFIDWVNEDKSKYPKASEVINPRTGKPYIDLDNDFLVGESGGFLMNIHFKFINTHLFSEVARFYEANGYYCPYHKGTKEYISFWARERRRRISGMVAPCGILDTGEIINIRITGDHYNYLNYSRISRTPTESEIEEQRKKGILKPIDVYGFPRFWDADYWNFKIDEFCMNNDFNICKGKARRKGYTYKEASADSNLVNLYPKVVVTLAAYDRDEFLLAPDKLADICKKNLDWYETNTIWRRGFVSESLSNIRLGYKESGGGHKELGYLSSINSVSCALNPSKAIGGKARKIVAEESGKFPNVGEVVEAVLSNTESGRISVGMLTLFGTGGVKKSDWAAFERLYYNPNSARFMPFENVWDKESRDSVCGFFHPNIWAMEDLTYETMDKDGNSNLLVALKYDLKDKKEAEKSKTLEDWIIYCSQRANSPSEAFSGAVENMFSSPELTAHINRVERDKDYRFYVDGLFALDENGKVCFKSNEQLAAEGNKVHPYITNVPPLPQDDRRGCVRLYHYPFKIDGEVPPYLYRISYDPTAVDKNEGKITDKDSLACFRVRMMKNDITPFRVIPRRGITVANFIGRFPTMEEEDRQVMYACEYYNAQVNVEINRGETKKNFTIWKKLHRIAKNPILNLNKYLSHKSDNSIGTILTETLKRDGLGYCKNSLYEVVGMRENGELILGLHYETDIVILKSFQRYKGKSLDAISVAILDEFDNMALEVGNIKARNDNEKSLGIYSAFNNNHRYKSSNLNSCIK